MSEEARCREVVVFPGESCGRPAEARLRPGNTPLCGVHARAYESRGAEVEQTV